MRKARRCSHRIGPALDALAVAIGEEATGEAEHLRLRLNVQTLWAFRA